MKANELMIGDWVIHDYYKTPIQIKSIPNAEQIYHPVLLTAEILEKNPRVKDIGYWDKFGNDKVFRLYLVPIINQWYVHTLQHALRLCGLNDLADNFKVE